MALLAALRGSEPAEAGPELERRAARLDDLVRRGVFDIPEVRAILANDRGERAAILRRGDPVYE